MSPVQAKVIPVSGNFDDYAREVEAKLKRAGISAEADLRNEKLGYKIREAQLEKMPYMFVVGENERNAEAVSVRKRGEGDLGMKPVDEIIAQLKEEIATRLV
ncbi:Threonine--tRNA ligase 2 [compost metagenome]